MPFWKYVIIYKKKKIKTQKLQLFNNHNHIKQADKEKYCIVVAHIGNEKMIIIKVLFPVLQLELQQLQHVLLLVHLVQLDFVLLLRQGWLELVVQVMLPVLVVLVKVQVNLRLV